METLLNLEELGSRLATVDRTIMLLVKRRMELAAQVGRYKLQNNQPIFRAEAELKRITEIAEYAVQHGLNPHFASALLYSLINESCKLQMIQLQSHVDGVAPATEEEWYDSLKRRLLALTERTCRRYDRDYDSDYFATRTYLEFEQKILQGEVAKLSRRELAIDIGCATGRTSFALAPHFKRIIGYDLSQHMVATADEYCESHYPSSERHVSFEQCDVEEQGIPLPDESVSFVVMNLGTASDMRNLENVWNEINRVLSPGGRFLLSFYNAEALLYRWEMLPWPSALAAQVNLTKHCLDVHVDDEIFSVYARPYQKSELKALLKRKDASLHMLTYPTVSAVLPNDLFVAQPDIQVAIGAIDRSLSQDKLGAYIIATGEKL